jgi:hypothetical protein
MSLPARLNSTRHCLETLLIAVTGGLVLGLVGIPAGYLSGSLLAVSAAALVGRPLYVPIPLFRVIMITIGVALGSVVTPETLMGMATWPISIAILAASLVTLLTVTASYLRFVHGWDPLTALFAATPGALSQVMALSAEARVDVPAVVIAQTVRVVILTVGIPIALAAFGLAKSELPVSPPLPVQDYVVQMAILLSACVAAALVFLRFQFPGGLLFGAMAASAILHGAGLITVRLPAWAVIVGMIGIGAVTGSRFVGTTLPILLRHLKAAVGSFAVAMAVTACFVFLLISVLHFRVADVVMAFSPGAQDAMMILAIALHLDPVYVGAHHVSRFFMVSMALPFFVRIFGKADVMPQQIEAPPQQPRTALTDD